jgi:acetyl esterase
MLSFKSTWDKQMFTWFSRVVCCVLVSASGYCAQKVSFPIDDSYTVQGSFARYHKDFPNISLPKVETGDKVKRQLDVVYFQLSERTLHLDIFSPQGNQPNNGQTIVMIHGGGWASGNKSHMHPMANALALRGYTCIAVEYRLSPEAKYPAALNDIHRAINWITEYANTLLITPEKLAILGTSSGGHLAALVGFTAEKGIYNNGRQVSINAIIDLDGVLNVADGEGLQAENKQGDPSSALARWLGGNFESKQQQWQEVSVLQYVSATSPPLLFLSSDLSRFRAGFTQVEQLLQSHNIQVKHQSFDQTPHTFWLFNPWFEPIVEQVDKFLKNLK